MHHIHRSLSLLAYLFAFSGRLFAQNQPPIRVEPAFWWVGMAEPKLQILLHGKGISSSEVALAPHPGVTLTEIKKVASPNYLFVYLNIAADAKPGQLTFTLKTGKKEQKIPFTLSARDAKPKAQGYTPADVVYLIMPDRFANGNPANDNVEGMLEKANRKAHFGRHGGDLDGVTNHLDYFKDLGVSTIWLNPVQENDMPASSYHGYAITDYYAVDKRFGGMPAYLNFIGKAHAQGVKVVMDMVMNHIGTNHYWLKDLPDSTWIHQWPTYTASNFRSSAVADPHAAPSDIKRMESGWFDNTMADVNQRHPLLADYLIQNSIWWIEHTGIDAIRMDTWPYNDQPFMSRWSDAIMRQYPSFKLVGEVWVPNPALTSYFMKGGKAANHTAASLTTVTDFAVRDGIIDGLNQDGGWETGLSKIYNTLGLDYLYAAPENHLIFPDNHDMSRLTTALGESEAKVRQAYVMTATLRGVPQLYYGDEWFMTGDGGFHPNVRRDFPGGWAGDSADFFTGRAAGERNVRTHAFVKQLLAWRKTATPVHNGRLMQYIPEDNVYVYFRYVPGQAKQVMVAINGNKVAKTIKLDRFADRLAGAKSAKNGLTGAAVPLNQPLALEAQGYAIVDVE